MHAIPERLKPGEPLPDLRGLKCSSSTISWATAPNQDVACSKGLLHSSVEDNLSMTNSCDSANSKVGANSDLSSYSFASGRAKSTSPFNKVKITSPFANPFTDNIETDLDQPTDYSLKYLDHTSDEDKQSSAYFTGTDQEQDNVKTCYTERTQYETSLNSSRASSASDLLEDNRPRVFCRKTTENFLDSNSTISSNGSKYFTVNATITGQNKQKSPISRASSRADSVRSTTTSGKSVNKLTLSHPSYMLYFIQSDFVSFYRKYINFRSRQIARERQRYF